MRYAANTEMRIDFQKLCHKTNHNCKKSLSNEFEVQCCTNHIHHIVFVFTFYTAFQLIWKQGCKNVQMHRISVEWMNASKALFKITKQVR